MNAFTVMVFVPVIKPTAADHAVVPLAVPDPPVELFQVTDVVPADAVPLTVMLSADVETIVKPGDVICSAGGEPGGGAGVGVGVGVAWE